MQKMIENLINGNLADAGACAKKYSYRRILWFLLEYGFSSNKAHYATEFLKHGICWQQYCDAK